MYMRPGCHERLCEESYHGHLYGHHPSLHCNGNMTPSFRVMPDGTIRQVYFYSVDVSEFAVNKLGDRGSLSAKSIVTNVQDFVVNVSKGLGL